MMQSIKISFERKSGEFEAGFAIFKDRESPGDEILSVLSDQELEKIAEFQHDERKLSYRNARIASKLALSNLCEQELSTISITKGIFDFPIVSGLKDKNIQVSISHAREIALAIAFPEAHPLGIDFEMVNPENFETLRSQLSEAEILAAKECRDVDVSRTIMWSMKEALSKILKTGLMISFELLETQDFVQKGDFFQAIFKHHKQYKAIGYTFNDFVFALVMPKNSLIDMTSLFQYLSRELKES